MQSCNTQGKACEYIEWLLFQNVQSRFISIKHILRLPSLLARYHPAEVVFLVDYLWRTALQGCCLGGTCFVYGGEYVLQFSSSIFSGTPRCRDVVEGCRRHIQDLEAQLLQVLPPDSPVLPGLHSTLQSFNGLNVLSRCASGISDAPPAAGRISTALSGDAAANGNLATSSSSSSSGRAAAVGADVMAGGGSVAPVNAAGGGGAQELETLAKELSDALQRAQDSAQRVSDLEDVTLMNLPPHSRPAGLPGTAAGLPSSGSSKTAADSNELLRSALAQVQALTAQLEAANSRCACGGVCIGVWVCGWVGWVGGCVNVWGWCCFAVIDNNYGDWK